MRRAGFRLFSPMSAFKKIRGIFQSLFRMDSQQPGEMANAGRFERGYLKT